MTFMAPLLCGTGAGGGLLGAWRQETVFGLRRVLQRPHNTGSPVC